MKKSILPFLFLFIIPICFFSQSTVGKIEYKENLSLGVPVVRHWTLFFDKTSSLYIDNKKKAKKKLAQKQMPAQKQMNILYLNQI